MNENALILLFYTETRDDITNSYVYFTFIGYSKFHFSPPLSFGGLTPSFMPLVLFLNVQAPTCYLDLPLWVSASFGSGTLASRSLGSQQKSPNQ